VQARHWEWTRTIRKAGKSYDLSSLRSQWNFQTSLPYACCKKNKHRILYSCYRRRQLYNNRILHWQTLSETGLYLGKEMKPFRALMLNAHSRNRVFILGFESSDVWSRTKRHLTGSIAFLEEVFLEPLLHPRGGFTDLGIIYRFSWYSSISLLPRLYCASDSDITTAQTLLCRWQRCVSVSCITWSNFQLVSSFLDLRGRTHTSVVSSCSFALNFKWTTKAYFTRATVAFRLFLPPLNFSARFRPISTLHRCVKRCKPDVLYVE
jgi:hypothetical protein